MPWKTFSGAGCVMAALLTSSSVLYRCAVPNGTLMGRTHEERPSLLVELKLDVPGKWRAVELRLAAEYLNVQHLAILRRYLDVCESVMQEAGASHE